MQKNTYSTEERDGIYYYPKNLRENATFLLWSINSFIPLAIAAMLSVIVWSNTGSSFLFTLTIFAAILSVKVGDVSTGRELYNMVSYIIFPQMFLNNPMKTVIAEESEMSKPKNKSKKSYSKPPKMPKKMNPKSSQQLVGAERISDTGIYYSAYGRYAMWSVQPFNLAVSSPAFTESKIRYYMFLLSSVPNLEVLVTDAARSYSSNIAYLKRRIEEETNPKIKQLLKADLAQVQEQASSVSYNRQYLFLLKLDVLNKEKQDLEQIRRVSKSMADANFNVHQLSAEEIQKVFANFFDLTNAPDVSHLDDLMSDIFFENDSKGDD